MNRGKVAVIKEIEIITRLAIKHVNDYYFFITGVNKPPEEKAKNILSLCLFSFCMLSCTT